MKSIDQIIDVDYEHQVEILKEHFDVDEKNKTVEVIQHFDSLDDITVNTVVSEGKIPVCTLEVYDNLVSLCKNVPYDYKINYSLKIDDIKGFNENNILTMLYHFLENKQRKVVKNNKKIWLITIYFFFVALIFIILLNVGIIYGVFEGEECTFSGMVYGYALDCIGCVIIWEGITNLFVSKDEDKLDFDCVCERLNSISVISENKVTNSFKEVMSTWKTESKYTRYGKNFILVAGGILLCTSLINISEIVTRFSNSENEHARTVAFLLIAITTIGVITGLLCLGYYINKIKTRKLLIIFEAILLIIYSSIFIVLGVNSKVEGKTLTGVIISFILTFSCLLLICAGLFLVSKKSRK